MSAVMSVAVPAESALHPSLAKASFHDAYSAPLSDGALTPTEIFLRTIDATPRWVSGLMAIRNRVVVTNKTPTGLNRGFGGPKDVGSISRGARKPASAYRIGDPIGIFTIVAIREDELLLGIDDSHLDVRVAVTKPWGDRSRRYVVSTVVNVHNSMGRAYMVPVGAIHPFIVRALMRASRV